MSAPVPSLPPNLPAVEQEQSLVHDVYNDIAGHFSQTRYKPWPIVEKFLTAQPKYSIGIDVGCGNGKYLGVNKNLFIIGTDRSEGLIRCAHDISSDFQLGVSDGLHLPHECNRFDFAISIAVIHHFATETRRIEAISHILSKLRVGGRALIYCWALEQENSRRGYKEGDEQDILVPWVLKNNQKKDKASKKKSKKGSKKSDKESESPTELVVEPELEPEPEPITKYRYYHLYKKGELVDNSRRAGSCTIVDEGYERDNWWVIIEKTP